MDVQVLPAVMRSCFRGSSGAPCARCAPHSVQWHYQLRVPQSRRLVAVDCYMAQHLLGVSAAVH